MSEFNRGGPRRPRRDFGGGGFDGAPREMHKATCAECGGECEVPFKPTEGRPVYCKDCFAKRRKPAF
jgi:CxxC-x17-CxxC domain-containing protein